MIILRIRPEIPIILCSGTTDAVLETLTIRAFIVTPLSKKTLATAVRKGLDHEV